MQFKKWLIGENANRTGAKLGLYPSIEDALGQYPPLYGVPSSADLVTYIDIMYGKDGIPGENGIIRYKKNHPHYPMKFSEHMEDIFGFDREREKKEDILEDKPIHQFNIEYMMNILLQQKLGLQEADGKFVNEVVWGGKKPGAIKLEVDTGYSFYIKRLNYDLEGNQRWITKKMFQLNRRGLAGYEESIAHEIYQNMKAVYEAEIDAPRKNYELLEKLVVKAADKMKKVGKPIFLYKGIKKVNENCYQIIFELRGSGTGDDNQRDQQNNVTQIMFDEVAGVLRVSNYAIGNKTGRDRKWQIAPDDLNVYFYPTQDIDEITEVVMVHFKYY